ncbi:LEPR-XLL domain-containing protein [Tautonia marina]|uniref:LEPR-XLL domain-containing protein n=1 Tax=Tautonia marina TaxID=2653855 RepID=UPI0012606E31|nr:LEPR-XLL domain-containing protein [Tautonia marina]
MSRPSRSRSIGRHRPKHIERTRLQLEPLEPRTMLSADLPMPVAVSGAVGAEVLALEIASPSASAHERFVNRIATALVDQPLADAVQDRLVGWLDRGMSRERAAAMVLQSEPARRVEILNTYEKLLHREPTAGEFQFHLSETARGADQLAVIWRVIGSAEYFQNRGGGTHEGYLNAMADDLWQRSPTETETARWVGALDRGVPRSRVVADLLRSPSYREATAVRIASIATPGRVDEQLAARVSTAWQGPRALTRAKALMLGSAPYLDSILATPSLPPVSSLPESELASPPPVGYPFTPEFSLLTNWNPIAPGGVDLFSLASFGASPDGNYWVGTIASGLFAYDPVTMISTSVWSGAANSIAPISNTEAWLIGSDQWQEGPLFIASITSSGTLSTVADLPGGDSPSQIGASADGIVWVLGGSGTAYSYQEASDSWSVIPNNGFSIKQLGIGSASNIWAIGSDAQGSAVLLSWSSGGGWAVDSEFSGTTPTEVSAAADGSVWVVADSVLFLRPPGGSWAAVTKQTPPGMFFGIAANDRNRVLASFDSAQVLQVLSFGLLDRPATPFPEVTDQWDAGYAAINAGLGIVAPGGVRALYNDAIATLSGYLNKIESTLPGQEIPRPPDVSPTNWDAIKSQLINELNDVMGVNNLYTQLTTLNSDIGTVTNDRLVAAGTLVALTQSEQQNDTASLAIVGVFEAALAAMAAAFSGGAAIGAAAIASGIDNLIGDLTNQPNPGPDTKLEETYAALLTTLGNLFTDNVKTFAQQQTTIVGDYGMLSTLGTAISSGLWDWEDVTTSAIEQATSNSYDLFFYQTLMPIKWQIVYMEDYICDLYVCNQLKPPTYDLYEVVLQQSNTSLLADVWFVNQIGASTNPFDNPGPYPTEELLTAIWNLGVSQSDFYNAQNGWDLKIVNAT